MAINIAHLLKSSGAFKNKFSGQRAFIIGNGPSLNKLDLAKLKDEITFGVNSIFYLFDEMGFKPTFYVVEDKLVAEDRADEINELSGMVKIFGEYLNYCLRDKDDVIWANVIFNYSEYPGFPHFSRNAAKCLWVGGTVSYLCLQLAYYMGFDEVYLIGFDHSYAIPPDAKVEGTVIISNSDDPNHFHPEYFGRGKRWHGPRLDRMELAYRKTRQVFEQSGRKIYNATAGGKLEIFPRVDYESLFTEVGKVGTGHPIIKEPARLALSRSAAIHPVDENSVSRKDNREKVRVSVVVCTHRNPALLVNTIESLTQQILNPELYEVIVVDNNSQDYTRDVVGCYPSVRYIFEKEIGLSHARNAGIRAARGDIIAFIDDDAEASRGWVKALLKMYDSIPDAWVVGGKVSPIWDAEKPEWLTEKYYRSLSLVEWGELSRPLHWPERIIGTNCSFRRQVFTDIGYFDISLGRIGSALLGNEDTEIQQRINVSSHSVYYTPQAVVYHHVPASRMTKEYFQRRLEGTRTSKAILTLRSQRKDREVEQLTSEKRHKMKLASLAQKKQEVLANSNMLLSHYKDRYYGRRCIIIGNGPSLNQMDWSLFKDEYTFGLNRIYLLFDKMGFCPTFHVAVNPLVIEQSIDQIYQTPSQKFLSLNAIQYVSKPEGMVFLRNIPRPFFSKDIELGIWEGHTVTYVAMQLAYHMGFTEVVLIGVDHNFVTKGPANLEVVSQGDDPNHFHPNYFGMGVRWHLPDLENSEKAYRLAKGAYESDGRIIIDATAGGKLNIFPKVDYRSVFKAGKRRSGNFCEIKSPKIRGIARSDMDNNKKFLVSAIVSTYNSERFILDCLEDLENQTIADKLEIIVVNSGSQQNEEAVVKEFQKKYDNVKYIKSEKRETVYRAWNRAIKVASGKYITNANTDDRHRKDAFEKMAKALEENPDKALVYINQNYFKEVDGKKTFWFERNRGCFSRSRLLDDCIVGSQPMWRGKLHEEFGYFDGPFFSAGDYEFWLRIAQKYSFLHLDELLGERLIRRDSLEYEGGSFLSYFETALIRKCYQYALLNSIPIDRRGLSENPIFSSWCEMNLLRKKTSEKINSTLNETFDNIAEIYDWRGKNQNSLLTIVIVTYNRRTQLLENLNALNKQTEKRFEVVVVDNGQSMSELTQSNNKWQYELCYIKMKQNYGPSLSRNTGAGYARGKYIAFLDDDAIADGNWAKNIISHFQSYAICGLRGKVLPKTRGSYVPENYDLGNEIIVNTAGIEMNSAYRKDVFLEHNGFDENLFGYEGAELSYRIYKSRNERIDCILYFPDVIIFHDFSRNPGHLVETVLRNKRMEILINKKWSQIRNYLKFMWDLLPINRDENNYHWLINQSSFLAEKEPEQAIVYANKAVMLNPLEFKGHHILGLSYLKLGELSKARVMLKKAKELVEVARSRESQTLRTDERMSEPAPDYSQGSSDTCLAGQPVGGLTG